MSSIKPTLEDIFLYAKDAALFFNQLNYMVVLTVYMILDTSVY